MIAIAVLPGTPPRQASWHDRRPTVAPLPALRWIRIDPNLRGRVTPATLDRLRAAGLCVHRIGAAAHVHDAGRRHRWILTVVPRGEGEPVPAFAARLEDHHRWLRRRGGSPLPAEARRQAAADAAFLELDRAIPWWKVRADW